jgi:hypothetical protein
LQGIQRLRACLAPCNGYAFASIFFFNHITPIWQLPHSLVPPCLRFYFTPSTLLPIHS